MMRPTFSGAKNSGAGSVAACTLTNASIASWFPLIAPSIGRGDPAIVSGPKSNE
jgi:hypothetical protein